MAKRSLELDRKIHEAAYREFMEKGFMEASMRDIAYRAGVTIGALYTRYSTKDEMFKACVADLMKDLNDSLADISAKYQEVARAGDRERFKEVMRYESEVMNGSLLRNYDQWILLLHRSVGSSVSEVFDKVVRSKTEGTLRYFDSIGVKVDREFVTYMIDMQMHSSLYAVSPDRSPEDAVRCMQLDQLYHSGGWAAVKDMVVRDD